MNRDSLVGIATGLRAGRPGFDSRKGKWIILYSTAVRLALRPICPPNPWMQGGFPRGVKQQGREANQSPQSSAEVKNGRAILPLAHMSSWLVLN
jgi:hypothetical protein